MLPAWTRTLRGRLLAVYGAGLALLISGMAANVVQLHGIGLSLDLVNRVYLPLTALSTRMGGLLDPDPESITALGQAIAEARVIVDRAPVTTDAEEAAALNATRRLVDDLASQYAAWQAPPHDVVSLRGPLREEVLQLGALADGRIDAVSEKTGATQVAALRQAGGLVLLALGMGAAVLYLAGTALEPVGRLTRQVERMAAGESVAPLVPAGDDEIATLGRAFATLAQAVADRDAHLQALTLYLRRVLDSIGAAVIVVERQGVEERVQMANPPAAALWGIQAGDTLPDPLARLTEGRHEALSVGHRHQDVVVRPFGENGRILVGEDSTDRVRDRDRLQRSERLALVGQLLAQVTHEVRNPLNALSLNAELLADEVQSEEGRALMGLVGAEIRRLEAVTERYLDLARRRPPELGPEDAVLLARSVVALEEEGLRRQGIEVEVEGLPGSIVETDGNVLRRALLNLLRNAAEAGAHHLTLSVHVEERTLTCRVADDGPGMAPDVAARVFEPFYSTRTRGTGLGLAITRQSIEDLGGRLEMETAPGRGSTFTITLPAPPDHLAQGDNTS